MNTKKTTLTITLAGLLGAGGQAVTAQTTFNSLFKTPASLPAGVSPYDVKAGDFNGDGRPDVAVVNRGLVLTPNGPNTNFGVSVYLANSTGQLVKVRTDLTAPFVEPTSLAIGDLNGDGLADLVVGDFGRGGVVSFLGDSALGINPAFPIFSPADTGTASVDLGFLDAGTVLDAATVNLDSSSNTVSRLIGDGLGGFAPAVTMFTIGSPRFIRIGNLDTIGDNDAMIVSNTASVAQLLFSRNGIFNSFQNPSTGGGNEQGALGDIDGDNDTDVAFTSSFNGGKIVLFRNNTVHEGTPLFASIAAVPVGSTPYSVVFGDVDGDGDQDLCVTHSNSSVDDITVALNDGAGTFSTQLKFAFAPTDSPRSIELFDIDMDGDLDLLTTRKPDADTDAMGNPFNGELLIFENLSITNTADLNGDGVVDAADLASLLAQWGTCPVPPTGCPADFNGDGFVNAADLATLLANWTTPPPAMAQPGGGMAFGDSTTFKDSSGTNQPSQNVSAPVVPWVVAHFGFDSVASYTSWLDLLTEQELFDHITAVLDLIAGT